MTIYTVQNRATGEIVHAYTADGPDHSATYPYDTYNHIPVPPPPPEPRAITGIAFLRRFTLAQRIAVRGLSTTDPLVQDFMALLDAAIAAGGDVNLDDPDTAAGVSYLAAQLPDANIDSGVILA